MTGNREVDAVALEQRSEGGANREIRSMLAARAVRGAMIERDLPRLPRAGEIRLQPGELGGPPRRVLERVLGVERDEVHRTVVEAVITLALGQDEEIEVRLAVASGRAAVVVPFDRHERQGRQPFVDIEEIRLVSGI